jgi:phosphoglycerate dehydrogenase-like enzyme
MSETTIDRFLIAGPLLDDAHVDALRRVAPSIALEKVAAKDVEIESDSVEGILLGYENVDLEKVLANRRGLRWIHSFGAGVDRWIGPALKKSGVVLTNNSGVHGPNIAEHVLATMLAFARDLPSQWESGRAHRWNQRLDSIFELQGQTLAIVGLGAIGEALATRAAAFGMRVIGVKRRAIGPVPRGVDWLLPVERVEDALAEAHHVVDILPLTAETVNFFNRRKLSSLRPGARFYNVGRGSTVDTDALVDLLRSGRIAGAALDVTDPEPLPPEHPLWDLPNVLITSHTAGATPRYQDRTVQILSENLVRIASGEPLVNQVDQILGY